MIYLLWPTARPFMLTRMWEFWKQRAACKDELRLKVAVDNVNQRAELAWVAEEDIRIVPDGPAGVTRPATFLTRNLQAKSSDVVVLASDDFLPPKRWDVFVRERLRERSACLIVNDGTPKHKDIVALPIMPFWVLERLNGILYHPAYRHLYSDKELHLNLKELDLLYDVRYSHPLLFEHLHFAKGKRAKDGIDRRNEDNTARDKKMYAERSKLPLAERLKM